MYVFWRAAEFFESLQPDQSGLYITFDEDGWNFFREWASNPIVLQYVDSLNVRLNEGLLTGKIRYEIMLAFTPGRRMKLLKNILLLNTLKESAPQGQIATKILHDIQADKLDAGTPGA